MKLITIALKDMTRSFRSLFAVMFMFGVPLLMATMFYFMFGNMNKTNSGFNLPATKVVIANLDQGGPAFDAAMAQVPGNKATSMGGMLVTSLQGESFADLLKITLVDSAEAARSAVDQQSAGVAVIIPADFSVKYYDHSAIAKIEMYKDPTQTIGPGMVQSILAQFTDTMAGTRIAVNVVEQSGVSNEQVIGQVVQRYLASSSSGDQGSQLVKAQAPRSTKAPANPLSAMIGMILGGMTIFYAFFTGTSSAQSILREDEDGTLPRLFTTPTSQSTILGGKFLAIVLTIIVQMVVLLSLGRLIFGIHWGALLPLTLVAISIIVASAGFGIFVVSLLKNTKQSGAVFGGALTVTGMVGMIKIFTMGNVSSPAINTISLFVPQGWATRGLLQVMDGAPMADIGITSAVLVVIAIVLFSVGVLRFQKRFA